MRPDPGYAVVAILVLMAIAGWSVVAVGVAQLVAR